MSTVEVTNGNLEYLDPKSLLIGVNVRQEAVIDDALIDSIRELGVLEPIIATRTEAGVEVAIGQRRTLAAVQAKRETVPVIISSVPAEELRLAAQIAENQLRMGLDQQDTVAALRQLALFDIPVATIVKQTGVRNGLVEQSYKVAKSKVADSIPVTFSLETAALIAEFDDDAEQQEKLLAMIDDGVSFYAIRSAAEQLISARRLREFIEQTSADTDIYVLDSSPGYRDPSYCMVRDITGLDGKPLSSLDEEQLVELFGDGLAIWPRKEWSGNAYEFQRGYAATWDSIDELGAGYKAQPGRPTAERVLTPEEIAAEEEAQAERVAAAEAAQRARTLRHEFWKEQLQRKEPPRGWERFVAKVFSDDQSDFEPKTTFDLLGSTWPANEPEWFWEQPFAEWIDKNPTRAAQFLIACHISDVEKNWHIEVRTKVAYFDFLAVAGYDLTDTESVEYETAINDLARETAEAAAEAAAVDEDE